MQIVHWGRARQFFQKHPKAEVPLKQWKNVIQKVQWKNFSDIRDSFSAADWVEGKVVFDIKGNDYRLIAIVVFDQGKIYIRHVLTHEEYDRGKWKD